MFVASRNASLEALLPRREEAMNKLETIDVALDEMLVNLAAIVLRLSKPE